MAGAMASDARNALVVEVGGPQGVEAVTVYADRSARCDGVQGPLVWDRPSDALDLQIEALLDAGNALADGMAPMDREQLAGLRFGEVRLLWLTPAGACGIEGPLVKLSSDPRMGDVLQRASALMRALRTEARIQSRA